MSKSLFYVLVATLIVLAGATVALFVKFSDTSTRFATLQTAEQETRNRYSAAIDEIVTIQDSLNAVVLGDSATTLLPSTLQTEQRLSGGTTDEALARISVIKAGLDRAKDRIRELDARLKDSGVQMTGLQKMIGRLRRTVAEKEEQVALLGGQVDSLTTQVSGLTAEVVQNRGTIVAQEEAIATTRRELGTVFYMVGTRRELTEKGVVVASGGVLGLGKTLEPSGRYDESQFAVIDTDLETEIRVAAPKIEVISAQPSASYSIEVVGTESILRILNVREFRKVRHLVILRG